MNRVLFLLLTIVCIQQVKAQDSASMMLASEEKSITEIGQEQFKDYQLVRYSDETSKIFDIDGNWIHFFTEYKTDKFTGEKTSSPIEIDAFIPNSGSKDHWWPDVFEADIHTQEGFSFLMRNGLITISIPNGCSVRIDNFTITHDPNPFEGKSAEDYQKEVDFYRKYGINRNGYIPQIITRLFFGNPSGVLTKLTQGAQEALGTNYYVKSVLGNTLTRVHKPFKVIPLEEGLSMIIDGYYEDSTSRIYNLIGDMYQLCSINGGTTVNSITGDDVVLISCPPADTISRFVHNSNVGELYYSSGDYIKYSRRYEGGLTYDCLIHYPNSIITVRVKDEEPVGRIEYVSGDLVGYAYIESAEDDNFKPYRLITRTEPRYDNYTSYFYDIKTNRKLEFNEGSLFDREKREYVVLAGQRKKELEQEARIAQEKKEREEREMQPLYQKYGKNYVDALVKNNKILVGAPEELIKNYTKATLVYESQTTRTYEIKDAITGKWAARVYVDVESKKVSSVVYNSNW